MSFSGKAARRNRREKLRKTGGREVEVKLRIADREAMLRKLKSLKAAAGGRVHEMNTLYDTPEGWLAREGKLVRIRIERPAASREARKKPANHAGPGQRVVLTYKGPARDDGGGERTHAPWYKIREEHEVRVEDAGELERIFGGMGLSPCFRYEKYRSTYRLPGVPGLLVDLDETPIGDFLELEGESASIDRAAVLLGFGPADYITKSYGILFLEQRQLAGGAGGRVSSGSDLPRDMLFPSPM